MGLDNNQLNKLEAYLNNTMDNPTKKDFEQEIDANLQLQEFVKIYREIHKLEDEEQWGFTQKNTERLKEVVSILKEDETQQFAKNLKKQRQKMLSEKQPDQSLFKKIVFTAIAASLAILLYFSLSNNTDLTEIYNGYATWEELPSFVVKAEEPMVKAVAIEQSFRNKEFKKTITLANEVIYKAHTTPANVLLYKGVAQIELNDFNNAIATFNILLKSDHIDNHKGYWYTAMTYLKKKDKENTIKILEALLVNPNNFKYKEAKKLLNKIK